MLSLYQTLFKVSGSDRFGLIQIFWKQNRISNFTPPGRGGGVFAIAGVELTGEPRRRLKLLQAAASIETQR